MDAELKRTIHRALKRNRLNENEVAKRLGISEAYAWNFLNSPSKVPSKVIFGAFEKLDHASRIEIELDWMDIQLRRSGIRISRLRKSFLAIRIRISSFIWRNRLLEGVLATRALIDLIIYFRPR